MSDTKDQHLPIGFSIEHYQINAVLGVGGFGITYKARDTRLERWVALKEFLPTELAVRDHDNTTVRARSDRADDYAYALDRFLEEARTLARFSHPNIVRVVDFLQANGTAYLVMEYVDGVSLAAYLRQHKSRVAEDRLRAWFVPLLRGLAKVHEAGFLHRDIKPGNIYLREDGEPVLIDFGAAREAIGEHSLSVTGIFTAGYAPIEQYATAAKNQGPWTDLYAVGATLYRCVSGLVPTDSPSRQAAVMEGDDDPMVPAVDIGRNMYSEGLLALIDRLLVLQVKLRPHATDAVLAELLALPTDPDIARSREAATQVLREAEPEPRPQPEPSRQAVPGAAEESPDAGADSAPRPVPTAAPDTDPADANTAAEQSAPTARRGYGIWISLGMVAAVVVMFAIAALLESGAEPFIAASFDEPARLEAPPEPPAAPALAYGELVVRSNLVDDNLAIGGVAQGSTGPDPIRLEAGNHAIKVSKRGYKPWTQTVAVAADQTTTVKAELERVTDLFVHNKCDHEIRFFLNYQDATSGEWTSVGWWTYKPQLQSFPILSDSSGRLRSNLTYLHAYGEIIDRDYTWKGDIQRNFKGETYGMLRADLGVEEDRLILRFNCGNID